MARARGKKNGLDKNHASEKPGPAADEDDVLVTCQPTRFAGAQGVLLQDLVIEVPGRGSPLIDGASLSLHAGHRYGLIGPNGSGKSTLLRQLAIPGKLVPAGLTSLLVQQDDVGDALSPLQTVVGADQRLSRALADMAALEGAIGEGSAEGVSLVLRGMTARRLRAEAGRLANELGRASGSKAKEARSAALAAEAAAAEAEAAADSLGSLSLGGGDPAAVLAAGEAMLAELEGADLDRGEAVADALARAREVLAGLGFSSENMEGPDNPTRLLSGGWRMRVGLARALFAEPELLMLDEPSNHLDLSSLRWLQGWLSESLPAGTILLVSSHDEDFLDGVATDILRIAGGKLEAHTGMDYSTYADAMESSGAAAARESAALDRKKQAMESSMEGMLSKVAAKKKNMRTHDAGGMCGNRKGDKDPSTDPRRQVVKSRQKKLTERFGAEHSAKGTRFKLSRDMAGFHESSRPEVRGPAADPEVRLELKGGDPLGSHGPVLQFDGAAFGWGRDPILRGVTMDVNPGTRLGVVGDNGSGKSTLLSALAGYLGPTEGTAHRHPNLRVAHYSQHHEQEILAASPGEAAALPERASGVDLMAARFSLGALDARSHLAAFGLKGRLAVQPMAQLSGGQKARLALALLFFKPPHILLLDEPTNHLDMQTTAALSAALERGHGPGGLECGVVVASHNRSFLLGVCDELVEARGGALHRIPADQMEAFLS